MTKKTIVVNDIAASPGGGLTVLRDFYEAIKSKGEDCNWVFLLSKAYVDETPNIKVILMPEVKKHLNRILFDSFYGWKVINRYNPSVVFSLQNTIVYHSKGKRITYVHQPLPFQSIKNYSLVKKDEFKMASIQHILGRRIKKSIKNSDYTIVQTKWMEKAVKDNCGVDDIIQIYPNMPNVQEKALYDKTNMFFYPTSNYKYKNNSLLIGASKRMVKSDVECSVFITTDPTEQVDNIQYIGRIERDEVFDYYKKACLVFPSYIETFGYPLVEAKSAGTIVLASDCEFSHELLDGYENAYFFNPFDEEELFQLMKKVALGEIIRKGIKPVVDEAECLVKKNTWNQIVEFLIKNAIYT